MESFGSKSFGSIKALKWCPSRDLLGIITKSLVITRLWEPVFSLGLPPMDQLCFSPDGTSIAVVCSKWLFIIDLETKGIKSKSSVGLVRELSWTKGDYMLLLYQNGSLELRLHGRLAYSIPAEMMPSNAERVFIAHGNLYIVSPLGLHRVDCSFLTTRPEPLAKYASLLETLEVLLLKMDKNLGHLQNEIESLSSIETSLLDALDIAAGEEGDMFLEMLKLIAYGNLSSDFVQRLFHGPHKPNVRKWLHAIELSVKTIPKYCTELFHNSADLYGCLSTIMASILAFQFHGLLTIREDELQRLMDQTKSLGLLVSDLGSSLKTGAGHILECINWIDLVIQAVLQLDSDNDAGLVQPSRKVTLAYQYISDPTRPKMKLDPSRSLFKSVKSGIDELSKASQTFGDILHVPWAVESTFESMPTNAFNKYLVLKDTLDESCFQILKFEKDSVSRIMIEMANVLSINTYRDSLILLRQSNNEMIVCQGSLDHCDWVGLAQPYMKESLNVELIQQLSSSSKTSSIHVNEERGLLCIQNDATLSVHIIE